MTPQEAHEYIENEIRCIQRSKICDRDCAKCELVKEDTPLIEAYGVAILALEYRTPKKYLLIDGRCICPTCKSNQGYLHQHCNNCGQHILWGDTE